ncbi:serine hydrolase [Actinomycetospora sp. NBRC 106375]|uniref:serine hydrolase n=1 Tax=Actinomycetospora sp. NBRC 106375 TaxID=3032207 RepID=UPI002554A113|nr:serine hydrolase [Actinomycetospora sp. NBRC 106375]
MPPPASPPRGTGVVARPATRPGPAGGDEPSAARCSTPPSADRTDRADRAEGGTSDRAAARRASRAGAERPGATTGTRRAPGERGTTSRPAPASRVTAPERSSHRAGGRAASRSQAPPPNRAARRQAPADSEPRRNRGLPLGVGAAVVGALMAGTLITIETLNGAPANPLAASARALNLPTSGTEHLAPPAQPSAPEVDLAGAVSQAEQAGARDGFNLSVAVGDAATGDVAPGSNPDETFYTASLAKLFVAVDMLQRQRDGELTLGDRDLRLLHAALTVSSDPAMNALWTQYDGPSAITRVSRSVGLEDTTAPDDTSQWGEVQTSARDMVKLLRHIQVDLPAPDRDLLLGTMSQAQRIAGDGFDQGFGFLDGTHVPVKQGWLCCLGSRANLHSVAVLDGRFLVAVLTDEPPGYDAARQVVDAAASSVRRDLGDAARAG